jgi:hypothetical protein
MRSVIRNRTLLVVAVLAVLNLAAAPGAMSKGMRSQATSSTVPVVTVAATDAAASEDGPDEGTFTITRTGSKAAPLTVAYTVGGTAAAGTDYESLSGSAVIAAGKASVKVEVEPLADASAESAETVVLTLTDGAAYDLGTPSSATVTIADGTRPVVTVTAPDAAAGEGGNTGTFRITRTGPTTAALSVAYTMNGTAAAGDYTLTKAAVLLTGSVTIDAGQSSVDVTLNPVEDAAAEPAETAVMTLSAGGSYSLGTPKTATVTIEDNDAVTVGVTATDAVAAEGGNPGTFRITRTGPTTAALTVAYTMSGTAANGSDYTLLSGSASIPAGASFVDVTLTPTDDAIVESAETAVMTLAAGAGYAVGSPASATVNIADNDGTTPPPSGNLPTTKDQCKNGGWMTFKVFKNQGDCVSYVATGGTNPPSGGNG